MPAITGSEAIKSKESSRAYAHNEDFSTPELYAWPVAKTRAVSNESDSTGSDSLILLFLPLRYVKLTLLNLDRFCDASTASESCVIGCVSFGAALSTSATEEGIVAARLATSEERLMTCSGWGRTASMQMKSWNDCLSFEEDAGIELSAIIETHVGRWVQLIKPRQTQPVLQNNHSDKALGSCGIDR